MPAMKGEVAPRDAEWGERFFRLTDPDGHELGFAPVSVIDAGGASDSVMVRLE